MHRTTAFSCTVAVALVFACALDAAEPAPADASPEAREVAERAIAAMGDAEAWDGVRLVRFGFAGRRNHAWDRSTGLHRVEGETREGERYVVIHDLGDDSSNAEERQGRAWLDGQEVSGERAAELLENAYGAWVNDTYWLLMPRKLLDPGVHLAHEGTETIDGREHDVLMLTFGEVGLTPGDRYWAYVDRESDLMTRWAYRLQSQAEDAEPTVWEWQGWSWYEAGDHRVRLADRRQQVGNDRVLDLSPIEISDRVPDGLFDAP